jgi:hypothetical protein
MNTLTKFGLVAFCVTYTAQTIGGLILLKNYEQVQAGHDSAFKAGLYLLSIIERENIELTEFDYLAIEALKPNPPKKKGD